MSLQVIAGLPGDRVANILRDAVTDASRTDRSALLAVPGDADAVRARAALSGSAPIGIRVATLEGVIEAEWALMGDGRRLARGLGRDVLLARALATAGVSEHPGRGAVAVLGTLAERSGPSLGGPLGTASLADRLVSALAGYRASLLEHGMVERAEVCALLASGPPPAEIIAVDGFIDLVPEFETLLIGWADSGAEVSVSVPWRPDSPGTDATAPLVTRLVSAGATLRVAETGPTARSDELERVRSELFTGSPPMAGSGAVRLGVAVGDEAEARFIARSVAGLVACGALPESIVVAFAAPSRHAAWLRRALADEGIGSDIEASVGVGETPLGGALLGLRGSVRSGLRPRDTGVLLRSRFSGVGAEQADSADADTRRGGSSGRSARRHTALMSRLVDVVTELKDVPIGPVQAEKWKNLADGLLANGFPGVAPVPGDDGRMDAAAHRAFSRALQEALELGDGEVSEAEFFERFAALRVMTRGAGRPGHVLVTGVDAVPSGEFAHVIIGGLTAAEFPRRGSEDRLTGDAIAHAMNRLGIEVDPGQHAKEERRAFFLAVATARESLTLVRRGADDEGAPLRESVFWDEFLDLYRRPGDPLPPDRLPGIEVANSDSVFLGGAHRHARGELHDEAALAELAAISEVSPSDVESYLACPYKWFVERRVRAEAPDRSLDPAAAGGIAHEALARFYREWAARGQARVTPESRSAAARLAAGIAREVVASAGMPESLEAVTLLDNIVPSVVALIERDAEFLPDSAPAHIEWAFGRSSDVPAIDLGGVALVGRADRIDIGPRGLVVVDYKRTHASTLAEIGRGGLVQLQLYAAAASRNFGLPVAGGVYRSLKTGADRGFVLEGLPGAFFGKDVVGRETLDALISSAVDSAVLAASGMRAGRVEMTPSKEACAYCAAAPFCGKAVGA